MIMQLFNAKDKPCLAQGDGVLTELAVFELRFAGARIGLNHLLLQPVPVSLIACFPIISSGSPAIHNRRPLPLRR